MRQIEGSIRYRVTLRVELVLLGTEMLLWRNLAVASRRLRLRGVRGSQPMRPDIRPGGIFPDYALPDHTGTVRKLSELQGRDPLILTLARGNYCPKEHQQHLELAAFESKLAVAYTQVATIATDDHHTLQEFRASVGAHWMFLSDLYNGYWFWGRPSVYDLWHDLRAATSEIRPDWDLSAPGLREAWDARDFSHFRGWDQRSPESLPTSYE